MEPPPTDELMAIAMARQVRDGEFVSHGSGVPLGAAALMLAKALHAPGLEFFYDGVVTSASLDLAALAADPGLLHHQATAYRSQAEIVDFELRGGCDFQFIRPLQVDRHGNVNVSLIGSTDDPRRRFHGIAVADAMTVVRRVCLYVTEHTPRVFVEQLDFVTGRGGSPDDHWRSQLGVPGRGPVAVVTPMAVLDFGGDGGTMRLVERMPGVTAPQVQESTGFELEIPTDCPVMPAPTEAERLTLARVDPLASRRLEFSHWRDAARARLVAATQSFTPHERQTT